MSLLAKKEETLMMAGVVHAQCSCCPTPELLVGHVLIGATRLACPRSRRTYLDRGDGLYQPDGETLPEEAQPTQPTQLVPAQPRGPAPQEARLPATEVDAAELLSDRPLRTPEKTRISLERATFAGDAGVRP